MRGWSHVVFRRNRDGTRHAFSLDFLLRRLDDWEVGPRAAKRAARTLRGNLARRG
jgi:hypothetical protein